MELEEVAHALYAGPPGDFVERRDAIAREARVAGDRDLATAVTALRRPTVGAWLANLLVRERRAEVEQLVDLGTALREAQDDLDPAQLRELGRQRRQLVSALVQQARRRAAELGQRVGQGPADELDATLTAVLADPDAATAVLSGTLTHGLEYAGLGFDAAATPPSAKSREPTRARSRPVAAAPRTDREAKAAAQRAEALDAAERALAQARLQAADARATADALAAEHQEAEQAAAAAVDDIERLAGELEAARAQAAQTAKALTEVRRRHQGAEREATTEERRAERAATAVEDLRKA